MHTVHSTYTVCMLLVLCFIQATVTHWESTSVVAKRNRMCRLVMESPNMAKDRDATSCWRPALKNVVINLITAELQMATEEAEPVR